jgi:hypothetical protein
LEGEIPPSGGDDSRTKLAGELFASAGDPPQDVRGLPRTLRLPAEPGVPSPSRGGCGVIRGGSESDAVRSGHAARRLSNAARAAPRTSEDESSSPTMTQSCAARGSDRVRAGACTGAGATGGCRGTRRAGTCTGSSRLASLDECATSAASRARRTKARRRGWESFARASRRGIAQKGGSECEDSAMRHSSAGTRIACVVVRVSHAGAGLCGSSHRSVVNRQSACAPKTRC